MPWYGQNGFWYRGGVPRSYIAPNFFVSVGFAICLTFVAIFMIFVGSVMTGVAYEKPKPPFDTPFFTKNDKNNPIRIIGPIVLGIGFILLLTAIILCCVSACLAKKQENRRHQQQVQQPLNSGLQTHTTFYTQQPAPQGGYNPTCYPQQPVPQGGYNPTFSPYPQQQQVPQDFNSTVSAYPSQSGYNYPSNPQVVYPPPPTGFYPSNAYPPSVNNMAPQNPQYSSATQPSVEPTVPPYNDYSKQPSNNPDFALLNDAPPSYGAIDKRTQFQ